MKRNTEKEINSKNEARCNENESVLRKTLEKGYLHKTTYEV